MNQIKKCGFCGAENSIENNSCVKCKQKLYAVNVVEKKEEKMEILMPQEELRDIKKKVVFWFWFGLISFVVFFLCQYIHDQIVNNTGFAIICFIAMMLLILAVIMFLVNLSKYFIEKEN